LVSAYRAIVQQAYPLVYSPAIAQSERQLKQVAGALWHRLLEPLAVAIDPAERVMISPASTLNLIPFETLVDGRGKYLIETKEISYLTSARDLLRPVEPGAEGAALIVANPDFDSAEEPVASSTSQSTTLLDKLDSPLLVLRGAPHCLENPFSPLPATSGEADSIATTCRMSEHFLSVEELTGRRASEHALSHLSRPPRLLHIASHAFWCGDSGASAEGSVPAALLQSGIALSGANQVVQGTTLNVAASDDGILTALEVSNLNLQNTELVALSGCETALGATSDGEGLLGLRRALFHAGVASTLISVWKVPDIETSALMVDFYHRWLEGSRKSAALRAAMLRALERARTERNSGHPLFWCGFILAGNPY
jgi:CHAT domain-containing protein